MTIEEIAKKYAKDQNDLLTVIYCVSDFLEKCVSKETRCALAKKIYYKIEGGHYNKEFADEQIPKMYYEDEEGKHYAPYWTEGEAKDIYEAHEGEIRSEYNQYDFEVTLNMIKSDYKVILGKWYDENPADMDKESWIDKKCVELAVNWLDDDDNPFVTEKVWRYFNS